MAVARINRPDILVYIEDVLNPSIWVTLRSFHQQENTLLSLHCYTALH